MEALITKIVQRRSITEDLFWRCPSCNKDNKDSEYCVIDSKLRCDHCNKRFKIKFADNFESHLI